MPYSRNRNKIKEEVINELKQKLNELPQTFKHTPIQNYEWKYIKKSKLPHVNIELPIMEVDVSKNPLVIETHSEIPDWTIVKHSCIVVDRKDKKILAVFIYADDDPNISRCVKNGFRLAELMDKYLPTKRTTFYSQRGFKIDKTKIGQPFDKIEVPFNKYTGKNWLEGLQRYYDGHKKSWVVKYYKRKTDYCDEYEKELLWLYCSLYELEKRHCPAVAEFRYERIKNIPDYTGCFYGCPIELNPATSMGGSVDFSSATHCDSSIRGTTETIIWKPKPDALKPYLFTNSVAKLHFCINRDCMIYQVGTDPHGTSNTGNHGGVGFVNLTKTFLSANTEFCNNLYKKFKTELN